MNFRTDMTRLRLHNEERQIQTQKLQDELDMAREKQHERIKANAGKDREQRLSEIASKVRRLGVKANNIGRGQQIGELCHSPACAFAPATRYDIKNNCMDRNFVSSRHRTTNFCG